MTLMRKFKNLMSRKIYQGATITAALLFMLLGVIFWGGFNTGMEATNTMEFCITCHEMEENVYQEYKTTIHYSNRSGVQATCSDCHVPDPWVHKIVRKVQASRELYHKMLGTIDTPEKFDEKRLELATNVWNAMKKTDSRECRNCHDFDNMDPVDQKPRSRKQHLNAMQEGGTCIDCHKGIAHKNVHDQLSDEAMDELTAPDLSIIKPLSPKWQALVDAEAAKKAAKKQAATEAKAKREAAKNAPKVVVEEMAVEQASKQQAVVETVDAAVSAASSSSVNWGSASSTEVVLFYPGQSSMEWILGRKHGGKRAFSKGDRCLECHEEEVTDIGKLIVSGEKLEPTPIPNKRGSIPVDVKAVYDDNNLYLRFSWPDTEHAPVPFVEGGKMDADNAVKLALMLATDDVQYASQAGCWGTCHADADGMPFAPEGTSVTKYLSETRTEIELKGRNSKPLGGWDKRKSDAEITALQDADIYMDLMRYKAGQQEMEAGEVLADREMSHGGGEQGTATLQDGIWVVEMQRPLQSSRKGQLNLAVDNLYNFGFAIHDDYSNGRFHHVSLGFKLGFDNPEAEISASKL